MSMTKKSDTGRAGRSVADKRDNVTWEWQTDASMDPLVVDTLGTGPRLDGSRPQSSGTHPYEQPVAGSGPEKAAFPRTLYDRRLLSEAIKRPRAAAKD